MHLGIQSSSDKWYFIKPFDIIQPWSTNMINKDVKGSGYKFMSFRNFPRGQDTDPSIRLNVQTYVIVSKK